MRRKPYIHEQYPTGVNWFGKLLAFHYIFLYLSGDTPDQGFVLVPETFNERLGA